MQLCRPRSRVPVVDAAVPGFGDQVAEVGEVFGGAGGVVGEGVGAVAAVGAGADVGEDAVEVALEEEEGERMKKWGGLKVA